MYLLRKHSFVIFLTIFTTLLCFFAATTSYSQTKTLKVWAHWTDNPGQPPPPGYLPFPFSSPVPTTLSNYPSGWSPWPINLGIPDWSSPGTVNPVYAWCELADQTDIDRANWGGTGWPGPQPPSRDEGYNAPASGFMVSEARVILTSGNRDFIFSIQDPTGRFIGTFNPTSPAPYSVTFTTPINGRGIWVIAIDRNPGSSQSVPALLQGPRLVNEPYVDPYGHNEGILGLEFVGEEIPCGEWPQKDPIKFEVEEPPGSGRWHVRSSLTYPNCVEVGQRIRLTANLSPPPLVNTPYDWNFGDPSSNSATNLNLQQTLYPNSSAEFTYKKAGAFSASVLVDIPNCRRLQAISISVCNPCLSSTSFHLLPPTVTTGLVEFEFDVQWPGGTAPTGVTYTWSVSTPMPNSVVYQRVTNTPTTNTNGSQTDGWNIPPNTSKGSIDLSRSGVYSVAVIAADPYGKPGCDRIFSTTNFEVKASPCATGISISPPQVKGCATGNPYVAQLFTAKLVGGPPQAMPTYQWEVEGPDGKKCSQSVTTGLTADPATGWTGTLAPTGAIDLSNPGKYTVRVTATAANCPPIQDSKDFVIPECLRLTGCSISRGTPGTITVSYSGDADPTSASNPADYAVAINGTSQPLGPGSVTYDPIARSATISGLNIGAGASVTITVTNVKDTAGNLVPVNGQSNVTSCSTPPVLRLGQCSINSGTPGTITVPYSADADPTSASDPANYAVTIDGIRQPPLAPGSVTYDPMTRSATIGGLNIGAGVPVTVTVTNVTDMARNPIDSQANANVTNCGPTPPTTPPRPTPSCSIWCILAGFFLIALPISAHISTVAHCLLDPFWEGFTTAVILGAIAFFVALCGVCCLWPFLIIGSILGVIAAAIAAYWKGFPKCFWHGVIVLGGYVAATIGFWLACISGG